MFELAADDVPKPPPMPPPIVLPPDAPPYLYLIVERLAQIQEWARWIPQILDEQRRARRRSRTRAIWFSSVVLLLAGGIVTMLVNILTAVHSAHP